MIMNNASWGKKTSTTTTTTDGKAFPSPCQTTGYGNNFIRTKIVFEAETNTHQTGRSAVRCSPNDWMGGDAVKFLSPHFSVVSYGYRDVKVGGDSEGGRKNFSHCHLVPIPLTVLFIAHIKPDVCTHLCKVS